MQHRKHLFENAPEPWPPIEPEKVVVMYHPFPSNLHPSPSVHSFNLEESDLCDRVCGRCGGLGGTQRGTRLVGTLSVVVVQTNGLVKLFENARTGQTLRNIRSGNDWSDEQSDEEDEQGEVQDSVSPDTSLSQLRLLHRINWRSDLSTKMISIAQKEMDLYTYLGRSQKSITECALST
jgi:hypothetical protein